MLNFRLAAPQDAAELHRLNAIFNGEGCNTIEAIEKALQENAEIVCVAAHENGLAGFCCAQVFYSFCYSAIYGEITELFVLEEFRRYGIGKDLVALAEAELYARGVREWHLRTGKNNASAQRFYPACGYTETDKMVFVKRVR